MHRLALDHITAVDATPIELAELARQAGCAGICLFMEAMAVLPAMPPFDIYHDRGARRALRRRMDDLGITLDLAYPFTIAGRTEIANFATQLECAADLGAGLLNVLIYDRDPSRRQDKFAAFCDLAAGFELSVAVEFYPVSQLRSLAAALELVVPIGRPGRVGINADLLHLMRSGSTIAELAAAPAGVILYGQLADGPSTCPEDRLDFEASSDRLLAGDGVFDLAGFAAALPGACPISVEIPRHAALAAGVPREERVRLAIDSVRRVLGSGVSQPAIAPVRPG